MPTFEPFKYFTQASYPAVLDFRLTTTSLATPQATDLGAYTELAGKGYKRISGEAADLFRLTDMTANAVVADSKRLAWVWREDTPETVTAVLLVATFPGETPQLVRVFPTNFTLSKDGPALAFSACICAERQEF